jgi:hypothetical protein
MREDLDKDLQRFPRELRILFFALFDRLDSYGLQKKRSSKRDGSAGNTVKFILNDRQLCSIQISPAEDLHFHFGMSVFESAGLSDELEKIVDEIRRYVVGDAKGVARERTSGLKLILTGSDVNIRHIIIERLEPLFVRVINH